MRWPLVVLLAACSGGDPPGSPDARPPPDADIVDPDVLRVGGNYATDVRLASSSCSGIQVMDNPTAVAHAPGATALTLTHAGTGYPGTVQRDGSFATEVVAIPLPGETHRARVAGAFSATGFEATFTADVERAAGNCAYAVEWVGTRQGGTNVIPE
jgi:hypothetical protein